MAPLEELPRFVNGGNGSGSLDANWLAATWNKKRHAVMYPIAGGIGGVVTSLGCEALDCLGNVLWLRYQGH